LYSTFRSMGLLFRRLPAGAVSGLGIEAAVFYYALAAWRRKPFVPSAARAFSYHKRNAYAAAGAGDRSTRVCGNTSRRPNRPCAGRSEGLRIGMAIVRPRNA
jgi:hypothetical protein